MRKYIFLNKKLLKLALDDVFFNYLVFFPATVTLFCHNDLFLIFLIFLYVTRSDIRGDFIFSDILIDTLTKYTIVCVSACRFVTRPIYAEKNAHCFVLS